MRGIIFCRRSLCSVNMLKSIAGSWSGTIFRIFCNIFVPKMLKSGLMDIVGYFLGIAQVLSKVQ